MTRPPKRPPRRPDEREDVRSRAGKVTFNHLQQSEKDTTERPLTPVEKAGGTDPDGVT